ncbi:hypothetical protein EYC59_02470 [Candidatus Saccharibacteria bacterium]|nr:MAG: hypothetical protein EYC59_02470 [Candidatus Saccharibacteria bacterium]
MNALRTHAQQFINSVTMYRLVVLVLGVISAAALVLSVAGVLSYSIGGLVLSLGIILGASYGGSRLFAYTFSTKHNPESWLITALILFLLLLPPHDLRGSIGIALAAFIAVGSKYLLAWRRRHIFNPAAIALVIVGLIGIAHAGWWVATPPLLPFLLVGGGLVVWKIRRFAVVGTFFVVSLTTLAISALVHQQDVVTTLQSAITSYPLIFLGTIMLTEPLTMPPTRRWQFVYVILVGILAHAQLAWWLTPALALCFGNLIAFATSQRQSIRLRLQEVRNLAPNTYEVLFEPLARYHWAPGQYLELSLPHSKFDAHGTRRVFSIASTPASEVLRLGITHSEAISTFKQALIHTPPGTELTATYIGGDFTLSQSGRPFVFLAGGIGLTPFRALLQQLIEQHDKRPVTLFYCARTPDALVWSDFLAHATQAIPLHVVPVVSQPDTKWRGETGRLSSEILDRAQLDLIHSDIYVSGPPPFVSSALDLLHAKGVPRQQIKTDYFSGY